jgi:hypothetical protein
MPHLVRICIASFVLEPLSKFPENMRVLRLGGLVNVNEAKSFEISLFVFVHLSL